MVNYGYEIWQMIQTDEISFFRGYGLRLCPVLYGDRHKNVSVLNYSIYGCNGEPFDCWVAIGGYTS